MPRQSHSIRTERILRNLLRTTGVASTPFTARGGSFRQQQGRKAQEGKAIAPWYDFVGAPGRRSCVTGCAHGADLVPVRGVRTKPSTVEPGLGD
jgi:hypothetical protein